MAGKLEKLNYSISNETVNITSADLGSKVCNPETVERINQMSQNMASATDRFETMITVLFLSQLGLIIISRAQKEEIQIPGVGQINWELPITESQAQRIDNILFTVGYAMASIMFVLLFIPMFKVTPV